MVGVRVTVRVRVRFAFCSLDFGFTEYIAAASFSMWCERELMLHLIWFHWMRHCDGACVGALGLGLGLTVISSKSARSGSVPNAAPTASVTWMQLRVRVRLRRKVGLLLKVRLEGEWVDQF